MDQSQALDLLNRLLKDDGDEDNGTEVPLLSETLVNPVIDFSLPEGHACEEAGIMLSEVSVNDITDSENEHSLEKQKDTGKEVFRESKTINTQNTEKKKTETEEKYKDELAKENTVERTDRSGEFMVDSGDVTAEQTRGRKRTINRDQWKSNIRKRRRQSGQEYLNAKGKMETKRTVKTKKDCSGSCKFKCSQFISARSRQVIFETFWKLNDAEKSVFYGNTTKRNKTKSKPGISPRKKCSIQYFFILEDKQVRVCKDSYLTTLDISQRRISWFHEHVAGDGTPKPDRRGRHTKSCVPDHMKQAVRDHINSFPRMPSHYCRARTSKEYLEQGLTLPLMYKLYLQKCLTETTKPVKEHMYRKIFDTEFNISFFVPKNDRCDRCAEYETAEKNQMVTQELMETFNAHLESKFATRAVRNADRSSSNTSSATICFDLQNVIACPRATASNLFYKRKLNVFNLTAHSTLTPHAYCCIWHEGIAGRGGNEITSCLIAVLERFVETHTQGKHLTLWSDSCIPQNRNSMMLTALRSFIAASGINTVTQKFSEPGHSTIQEVDWIHSKIEKALKITEVFSPLSFVRLLRSVGKQPMTVIQMKKNMFFDYQPITKALRCDTVPFSKVKSLKLTSVNTEQCVYKTSFTGPETTVDLGVKSRASPRPPLSPQVQKKVLTLSKEKVKDLKSMLKFMPLDDRAYMETLFANNS